MTMLRSGLEHITNTDPSLVLNRTMRATRDSAMLIGVIPVSSLIVATARKQASNAIGLVVVGNPSLDTP